WEAQEIELPRNFELLPQRFCVHTDTHGRQLVTSPGDRIPHQNVAVQTMGTADGICACLGHPVVIIGGAHLVRIADLQSPADPDDEDRWIFLENRSLALLAR